MSYIPILLSCHPLHSVAPHTPMQGYQLRPCRHAAAPGGSDRYSLRMTAVPFCTRKAILIHGPINTHTSSFTLAAPPPLFRFVFSLSFFFSLCCLGEKNSIGVVSYLLIRTVPRLDGRDNGGSVEGWPLATNAGVLSWCVSSVAANQRTLWPPTLKKGSLILEFQR